MEKMSYNYFANVYDDLTDNVNYKARSEYISGFFNDFDLRPNASILDLACGTCSLSLLFARKGYNIVGVDASQEMLEIASNKAFNYDCDLSLVCAKMQDYEANNTYDACICSLDSINHLQDEDDVVKTFNNVYNSLVNDGIFIFDVNTIYKHNHVLADNTFVFDEEDYYLVWDNEQLGDNKVRILLDLFVYNGISYDRFSEEFIEKAYSIDFLKDSLINSKFDILGIYEELSRVAPNDDTQRVFFVCKKVK